MDFHLSVMQSYVLKLKCYYNSRMVGLVQLLLKSNASNSLIEDYAACLLEARSEESQNVENNNNNNNNDDPGILILQLLIDNISRPAPNITNLLLKFDLDTPVERTILQPKFYYSCMKVILDILEKLLKPDVNALLHEFSFQESNPGHSAQVWSNNTTLGSESGVNAIFTNGTFIFAGMTLGTRIALLEGLSPRVFVVYRSAFATIVLAPLAYLSSSITLYQNLYFEGLYLASSSVASAISNLLPAITFVIAAFVGMERVNIRSLRSIAKIVGTIICVTGAVSIALLKGPKLLNAENLPSKSFIGLSLESDENWLLGCLFLLGSIVAWSIFLILQVPAYESHPNYISLSAWLCFMATLQSAVVTLFIEQDLNAWKITSILELGCSLYAGIMGSAVTFCLQAWCISRRGPLFYAMFIPVFTIICTVLAALLLHEEIYIGSLIGAIGVIIGLSIVLWGKAKDIVDVKEKTDSKSMINEIEEVKFLINESYEKEHSKSDLKEPLLPC
ncbi:hypothetical protein KIW84_046378 [Lathyrus oleraceus]|uniref:EamA domain-containing protein n=1 Tax=Pisum sativum TaxID=3888 RepID=A0A9D4XQT6_PEA|nr:hypothetical protein KIW84_046378 [Pisum sativum]